MKLNYKGNDVGIALKLKGRLIGILIGVIQSLVWITDSYITDGSVPIYKWIVFTLYCLIGWWLGKKYDQAQFYSEKDYLTGLYNRRFVQKIVPKFMAQVERNNGALSISLIDVNNFKEINDMYGHRIGDTVLQEISLILSHNIRKGDLAARWGGDEFLLVLYDRSSNYNIVIDRLHTHINDLSKLLNVEVSVSVGTAVYPKDAKIFDELVSTADKNMYHRKFSRIERSN
jgi:diguanylate cyclase (GGDEF)-like protein